MAKSHIEEQRLSRCLWSQMAEAINAGRTGAGRESMVLGRERLLATLHPHTGSRESEQEVEPGCKISKPAPPARLHLLIVLYLFQTMPPTRDGVFTHDISCSIHHITWAAFLRATFLCFVLHFEVICHYTFCMILCLHVHRQPFI